MSDPNRPLEDQLFDEPFEYDFFQAVRLLQWMLSGRPGVGGIARPDSEPVRFKVRQGLVFPPSSIHSLSTESDPPAMTVSFMGLTGIQGVLPHHYTEHILARAQAKDFAMAEFFDLFNHRLISLFYRAWEKHHFPVQFQDAAVRNTLDRFTACLFDWVGLGTHGLRGRLAVQDTALLRYAGLFGQNPRSSAGLEGILRDYFGVEAQILDFQGAWYTLSPEDQCNLTGDGINNQLGEGAIAGDAVWDPQALFRVRLGPLPLARYAAFLPDGTALNEFRDLVRFYVGPVMQFEIQLILQADDVPWPRLGDESMAGPRLGWCGWLKTEEFVNDADDAIFSVGK